jgi:SAM-dependent methyltransferase
MRFAVTTPPQLPDMNDPRYLHEVGWFLLQQKHQELYEGGGYERYRPEHSALLQEEVLSTAGKDESWLSDKVVVAVGSGCACELRSWRTALKVEVDPLLYAYQQLGMILDDREDAPPTLRLAVGIEVLPLLDEFADLVICRNALDHVEEPSRGLGEMWRILKPDGHLFLSVDLGGMPTPDEPNPFAEGQLEEMIEGSFEVAARSDGNKPHAGWRDSNSRFLLRRIGRKGPSLDKEAVIAAYERSLEENRS